MKRRAPGGVDGGAPGAKTRKWQDEISDSESLDEADLELPPSSDDDSPPKSSNAAILSPGGPEEASSSSLVGGGTAAAPAPPGDNTNMTAEQTTSSAPGGALTESEKRKRFLVQSFVRLSFSFGGSTRCDLVVETRVICQLPKKLKVERISGLVVTLIEVKDEIKAEREQRRRGEEKLLAFAGLGMTDVFASKEGGLNVPKPSEFPDEQGVLGVESSALPATALLLLTDCDDRLFLAPYDTYSSSNSENPLRILGRVTTPSDRSGEDDEDPERIFYLLKLLESPAFCAEPFEVNVTLDLGRMEEQYEKNYTKLDQVSMALLDFDDKDLTDFRKSFPFTKAEILKEFEQVRASSSREVRFEQAERYAGSREGMVFKAGARGLGYYEDVVRKRLYEAGVEDEERLESGRGEQGVLITEAGAGRGGPAVVTTGNHKSAATGAGGTVDKTNKIEEFPSETRYFRLAPSFVEAVAVDDAVLVEQDRDSIAGAAKTVPLKTLMLNPSLETVDFWLSARENEVAVLRRQEYTQARHKRVKRLQNELKALAKELATSKSEEEEKKRREEDEKRKAGEEKLAWDDETAEADGVGELLDTVLNSLAWNLERIKALERFCDKLN